MQFRHLYTILLSSFLLSCTMGGEGLHTSYNAYGERTANLPLAGQRGVNVDMMDYRLKSLITEAQTIEKQMDALLARMNSLHTEILTYKQAEDNPSPAITPEIVIPEVVITDIPATDTPQAITPTIETKVVKKATEHKPAMATKSPKSSTEKGIVAVREGVHPDKIRLVFDINGSTTHTVNFDKEVGLLTVTLPNTPWATATRSKTYKLSQLSGYEAKESGQGTVIALAVKNTATVKTQQIGATNGKPARLVVDLIK